MVGACLNIICLQALWFEPLLLRVKDSHRIFYALGPWLLEGSWSDKFLSTHLVLWLGGGGNFVHWLCGVLTWSGHIKLEALAIEHLIVVKSGRRVIESNVLAGEHFVVTGTTLIRPLSSRIIEVILYFLASFENILVTLYQ